MAHDDDSDDPKFDYQDPSISSADNQVIWKGSAGQIVNLGTYLLCATAILVLWVLMPGRLATYGSIAIAAIAGIEFAKIHLTRYELTSERLTKRWGILTTRMSRVALYRVEDSGTISPFVMRLFGRGVVYVTSSDRSDPDLNLLAVRNPEPLEDLLRKTYERARGRKGTRVIE
ncbi:PH domain-containing protein [Endozoicomonas sp. G2_2]|uniref:PH domain-containing protein n=1 Tax=Endozoicomonas sp. G2_2 TaxID=2821092 RepID=UPI001ADACE63|nr:PH domain-containing protein [Endozoicomonas sp. G2_2]MBO9471801.1 PH domain-containing protein [Endozoicomonas sp. G2_2]